MPAAPSKRYATTRKRRTSRHLPPAQRNRYTAGATVRLRLIDADGHSVDKRYRLIARLPGGFAADVWRATDLGSGRPKALKLFTAQHGAVNRCKKRLRDLTHAIWFQSPYPYSHLEDAVRSTLLARKLLHRLSMIEFGAPCVVDAEGYFWERGARSFGLVLEWLEGRGPVYRSPDRDLIRRWLDSSIPRHHEVPSWLHRLREWMAWADRCGFHEHVAQIYAGERWGGAWLSLTNVKQALRPSAPGAPRQGHTLWWIDLEPAFPHVIPCFWFHVRLSLASLRRGTFPSFDRIDTWQLRRRIAAYHLGGRCFKREMTELIGWSDRLAAARRRYDNARIDLCRHHTRLLDDPTVPTAVRRSWIAHWHRCGDCSGRGRAILRRSRSAYWSSYLLEWLPWLGRTIRRLLWREAFRRHYWRLASDNAYLHRIIRQWATEQLGVWRTEQRLASFKRRAPIAAWLRHAPRALLPIKWHRFTTDRAYRRGVRRSVRRFLTELTYRRHIYQQAFLNILHRERRSGKLSAHQMASFANAIRHPALACYLEGQYLYLMPKLLLYPIALGCAIAGIALRSPQLLLATLFLGGIYREIITIILSARYPRVPLGLAAAIAWLPKVGNLACLIQMSRGLNAQARSLLYIFIRKSVANATKLVPFLGGEDTLLEYYAMRVLIDLPCSAWDMLQRAGRVKANVEMRS